MMASHVRRYSDHLLRPRRTASAHSGTHSYVMLTVDRRRVSGSVQFPVHDLEHALGIELGADDDDLLVAVAARLRDIRAYATEHFSIQSEEGPWPIEYTGVRVLDRRAGSYAILDYNVHRAPQSRSVTIDYDGLVNERAHHEALVIVRTYPGMGRMRTEHEQEFTFNAAHTSQHVVFPRSGASARTGAAKFLLAEAKGMARRAAKRLRG